VAGMRAAMSHLGQHGAELTTIADLDDLNTLVDFPAVWALDELD
jgi:hypothetical protein